MTVQSKEPTSAAHTSPTTTDTGTKVKRYLDRKVVEKRGLNGEKKNRTRGGSRLGGVGEREKSIIIVVASVKKSSPLS